MCPHHVSDVKLAREPTSCKNLKVKICIPPSKLSLACYGEQESASRKVADHADHLTSSNGVSIDAPLHELSDYHLYEKGENIVFSFAFNPSNKSRDGSQIPFGESQKLKVYLDFDSKISRDNQELNDVAGGSFKNPSGIREDATIFLTLKNNKLNYRVHGIGGFNGRTISDGIGKTFHGTRSEVFQFGPLVRSNRNFIIFEIDKKKLFAQDSDKTFVSWARSYLSKGDTYLDSNGVERTADQTYSDLIGRALKDQNPVEIRLQNGLHPSKHVANGFGYPDVVIYDTSKPAGIPNGRALEDDIITYLQQFNNTTPPTTSPSNRDGVDFAANAQVDPEAFTTDQGFYEDVNRNDMRIWGSFPYVGDAYNIPSQLRSENVYRFYDKVTGSHYLTSNAKDIEKQQGKKDVIDEGVAFVSTDVRGKAVYRFINTKKDTYFWTASIQEYDKFNAKKNYTYEGETFWVQPPDSLTPGSTEVTRLFEPDSKRYFWTANPNEVTSLLGDGWVNQGLAWTV